MENKQTNQMCLFVTETLLTCLIGSGCLLCADVSAVVDSLLIQPHMKCVCVRERDILESTEINQVVLAFEKPFNDRSRDTD